MNGIRIESDSIGPIKVHRVVVFGSGCDMPLSN